MKEFDLIGDVGIDITSQQVASMLSMAEGEDVTFYIASLGGSLSDGLTIYALIKKYPGKTKCVMIGNTASAGTVIALGANETECNENAPFLIHPSSDPEGGNAKTLLQKAGQLQKHDKILVNIYKQKTGLPEETIIALMEKEDWLSPQEAKEYGFVDTVISGVRAVAYYTNSKISDDLLTKLNNKMGIFSKKKDNGIMNVLALKDGKSLIINAENPAVNVEVAPVGAMSLEDGTYELADGRKITVAGGVITEVVETEPAAATNPVAETEEIVKAVTAVVAEQMNSIRAEFDAKLEALVKNGSKHTPPKGVSLPGTQKAPQASVHSKIKEVTDGIRNNIVQSRKA